MGSFSPTIASNPTTENVGKGGSPVTPTIQPTSQPMPDQQSQEMYKLLQAAMSWSL